MYDLVAREFPDYPMAALPALPEGYTDQSWHNDACPRIMRGDIIVFIDYPNLADRETGGRRYSVNYAEDFCAATDSDLILATDDWSEVLALLPIL